ncbi:tumor necrosis factor receptor superfamily member 1B [Toxotes jaculatrix]|uniref:tumor necrosis factor receptor superfamily member 1B n=1 Tax=Toxotes jaculatrix TaxID=941984 RepID=UPI001B3B15CA|nr:tumor necrosis factor receptor superfamily member 1B [Toxotes jaculatrix]
MKDILVLLILLSAQTTKVCSQPYEADSDGNCRDTTHEYLSEDLNLCCKKCPPGQRLKQECSKTTESVCEECKPNQYREAWNYAKNCESCAKCKSVKGLQYAQNCSSTTSSKCMCQPGMYCIIGFDDPYCTECKKYRLCKAGYGVSVPGTKHSDVKCTPCPEGTFSNTDSSTDSCRPHNDCHGKAVVIKGNATSDTVCEPEDTSTQRQSATVLTTASTIRSTVLAVSDSTVSVNYSTKSPPPHTEPGLVAGVITGVIVFVLLVILLACLCKANVWNKDAAQPKPKVDANGNCESGDKQINQGYLGQTQLMSLTVTAPEQQCLLEKGEAYSDHLQSSDDSEPLTRRNGCSNNESNGPLRSTVGFNNSHSALSEPMSLISNTEPIAPQPSVPSQSSSQPSSQPTSPQIISPVTTSPHVNVNITFHIGNGTCGTPSVMPTNLTEADCKLPFGEEEESFSIPQQENGKHSIMSVQDSESYSV